MDFELGRHPHTRFNPLTGEWILVSPGRMDRPWQGQVDEAPRVARVAHDPECALCPGNTRASGAVNPAYAGTFVFDNDFSALLPGTPAGAVDRDGLLVARSERGACRVVCFSPRHDLTLAEMDTAAIGRVIDTWVEEHGRLAAMPGIGCVQVFENRGAMMGCSNPHPHGQIWATESVPTEIAREDICQREYHEKHGQPLLGACAEIEERESERVVCQNAEWVAVVPFWAKWPFETLVLPRAHVPRLSDLGGAQREVLADILREVTCRYDNLFSVSFPYTMGIHEAPVALKDARHWQLHIHFYPPLLRSATVRKFMVGFEMLAMAQRDLTPEAAAEMLARQPATHYAARHGDA